MTVVGTDKIRVVFVCLGNICRSPMAEVVLRARVASAGLGDHIEVASAGTGDWHIGEQADRRALEVLTKHGYDGSTHRARQFERDWFDQFDLVVALDSSNLATLRELAPADRADDVRLLRSYDADADDTDVPDPYYGGADSFDDVLAMVERACDGLLTDLRANLIH